MTLGPPVMVVRRGREGEVIREVVVGVVGVVDGREAVEDGVAELVVDGKHTLTLFTPY